MTPVGREQTLHPGDEVVQVRHVGEHIVPEQQVGLAVLARDLRCGSRAEERTSRRHALLDRRLGDVGGRLDAETGIPARDEVLKQVAVVAGDLHHLLRGQGRTAAIIDLRRIVARAPPSWSSRSEK